MVSENNAAPDGESRADAKLLIKTDGQKAEGQNLSSKSIEELSSRSGEAFRVPSSVDFILHCTGDNESVVRYASRLRRIARAAEKLQHYRTYASPRAVLTLMLIEVDNVKSELASVLTPNSVGDQSGGEAAR